MSRSRWGVVLVIALLFGSYFVFDLGQYLTLDYAKSQQQQLTGYINAHFALSALLFFGLYILVAALSLPGAAVMTLVAGALFGIAWAVVLVSFASTLGATLAFLTSRFLLREQIQRHYGDKLRAINKGIRQDGAFYLFTLRLIPVFPFFLINLLMGLTPIPTHTFYWVSQLGMLPGTLVYVNAGTQLSQIEQAGDIFSAELLFSFALLALFPYLARSAARLLANRKHYSRFRKPARYDCNLVVIGAGAGGLVSAYIAAAVKARVTLIEKHKMGGDCLNTGCVPSKALIRSARFAHEVRESTGLGFEYAEAKVDFAAVMKRIQQVIKTVEPHDSVERYQRLGVECLQGEARIRSPFEVEINGRLLTTRSIVIATGAHPLVPSIPGLEQIKPLTSDTIWNLREQPRRLLVLGGGPVGCELAQSFARLGSQVTLLEQAPQLLPREDPDVAELLARRFAEEGVLVKPGFRAVRFEQTARSNQVIAESTEADATITIEFDQLLLALGRTPNTAGLGLEELGIESTGRGTIELNQYLQTRYPNIYAVGDVAGPYQFTHAAAHQAWYAAVNALFGRLRKFKVDYRVLPAATYTDPEVARVGLNEREAREQGIEVEVTRFDLAELDRAITDGVRQGFIKVLTPPGSDAILGATIVGSQAGELLAEYVLAMRYGLGLNKILGTVHCYPTMMEANKYAAGEWKRAHAPQRLLAWIETYHRWMRREKLRRSANPEAD